MAVNNADIALTEVEINRFAAQKVELTNNAFTAVQNYSPSEFEQFIFEYLLFVKKDELDIQRKGIFDFFKLRKLNCLLLG